MVLRPDPVHPHRVSLSRTPLSAFFVGRERSRLRLPVGACGALWPGDGASGGEHTKYVAP